VDLSDLIGALYDLMDQHGNVPVWLLDATNGRLDIESVEYNRSQRGVYVAAPQAPDEPDPVRDMVNRMRYTAATEG